MYNQVHQEQIVAGEMTLNIVEHPVVQEQVIVQENSELQVMERIQEQIVETTKEVPRERVQQRTVEQFVRMLVPQMQEQVIVQEIPQAVDSFPLLAEFVAPDGQPSPSGTNCCDNTTTYSFSRNSRGSVCSADTGTIC